MVIVNPERKNPFGFWSPFCSGAATSVLLRPEQEAGWRTGQEEAVRGRGTGATAVSRRGRGSPGAAQTAPQAPWVTWRLWPLCLDPTILIFHILLSEQLNLLVPAGSVWPALRWRNTSSSASGHTWVSNWASGQTKSFQNHRKLFWCL